MVITNLFKKRTLIAIAGSFVLLIALTQTGILEAAAPTVITNAATDISKTGATITGTITNNGGSNITNTGFELGTTVSYGQTVTSVTEEYQQTAEFGTVGSGDTEFNGPSGIDIDSAGNIYIVDVGNDRVKKYNSSHVWQENIVSADLPVDNGFVVPRDITVLNDDSIVVFDANSGPGSEGALLFIDASGTFTDCYGLGTSCSYLQNYNTGSIVRGLASTAANDLYYSSVAGSSHGVVGIDSSHAQIYDIYSFTPTDAEGGFNFPVGLTVDGSGNVYVAETGNNRVQKLSAAEAFVFQIGRSDEASGSANGEFSSPTDVVLDSDGNIFVTDSGNNRVQKFNSSGTYVSKFGSTGTGDNQLSTPSGIVVDANDDIYVVDNGNNRVVKYELGFSSDLTVHLPALSCGTTYHYRAFATNADGTSYGADQSFTTLDCDVPIARTRDSSSITTTTATLEGSHEGTGALTTTTRGFNYGTTISYGSSTSEDGDLYIDEFGASGGGGGNGTFIALNSAGTDADGNIYTTDQFEDVIQKFDSSGVFVSQYNVSAPAPGVTTPTYVRGAPDGKIYAVDYINGKIIRFDDNTFASPTNFAAGAGLANPMDIAFDSSGNIYVADWTNNKIVKLDSTGAVLLEVGEGTGSADGELTNPTSVGVDSSGNIYVLDSGNSRVQKFSSLGVYLDKVGSSGTGDGEFSFSTYSSLAVDADDYIYVADTSNNRIQKFDSSLTYLSEFGSSGTGPGEFSGPMSVAIGANGDIVVSDSSNSRVQIFNEYFTGSLTGLTCGTTYHYRAYATSPDGTGVGSDDTFDTSACPPDPDPEPSGGGGTSGSRFYCNDPLATNYTEDVEPNRIDNNLCRYPSPPTPDNELSCSGALFLSKPVRYGAANNPNDVKLLERYLNTYENAALTVDGVYAMNDYEAVVKWQEKYANEILKPWGLSKGTGYVFITSLRKIQSVHDTGCADIELLKKDFCYLYDQKLKRGDKIPLVKFAQKALRAAGAFSGNIDGVFGPITELSVKNFQIQNGLSGDGVIGATTGQKLEDVTCNI